MSLLFLESQEFYFGGKEGDKNKKDILYKRLSNAMHKNLCIVQIFLCRLRATWICYLVQNKNSENIDIFCMILYVIDPNCFNSTSLLSIIS